MDRRREPRVLLLLFGVADGVCGLLLGRAAAFWRLSVQPEQGDGPPFSSSQALYSVILIPEPRPIPGSGVLLVVDFAGSQSSAGGCPGARQRAAGGGQSDKRAISGFGLASLSSSQGGVATFVEPGSGPPLTVSLSPTGRSGSRQYRGGRGFRWYVWYQTAAGQGRKLFDHTHLDGPFHDGRQRRSSSSWGVAVPSDGSCPWEQRDNHSRTGDPVLVMREGTLEHGGEAIISRSCLARMKDWQWTRGRRWDGSQEFPRAWR